jgi:membrane carboxypeptidase/penicillin-binding protein
MRLGENSAYRPRLSIGFKKWLLDLNRTVDSIKNNVAINNDYGFWFDRSISSNSDFLTKLEIMVLFLEDRRFFIHKGFEFRAALRVLRRFLRRGKIGGMSTLDQQIVRISTRRRERTIARKVREILLAYLCNFHISKKQMLDYYLHNAYMGYGIEGCEDASQAVFGRIEADLSWEQAALIASLYALPFPKAAWDSYSSHPDYPMNDPEAILDITITNSDRWTKRIRARMKHALKNQDFRPKSL